MRKGAQHTLRGTLKNVKSKSPPRRNVVQQQATGVNANMVPLGERKRLVRWVGIESVVIRVVVDDETFILARGDCRLACNPDRTL